VCPVILFTHCFFLTIFGEADFKIIGIKLHVTESLRIPHFLAYSRKSPHFREQESSLPSSQEDTICPYHNADEFSLQYLMLFYFRFIVILYSYVSEFGIIKVDIC